MTTATDTRLPSAAEQSAIRKLWGRALDYDRKRTETCIALVKAVEQLEEKYPKLRMMSGREAEQYYVDSFNISRTYLIKMRNITRMHEALGEAAQALPAPWTTQQELASKFKDDYSRLGKLVDNGEITSDMELTEVREVVGRIIPPKPRKNGVPPQQGPLITGKHMHMRCECGCGRRLDLTMFTEDSLQSMIDAGAYTAPTFRN